jgi:arsenate reductase (thioredoxin)
MGRRRVLFICTHNSARSQMAEAMVNAWAGDRFDAFSAGTVATAVRPETIEVMRELGLDLGSHRSKRLDEFAGQTFERVVTVCDEAAEACPTFPGAGSMTHWSIADPSAGGAPDARLAAFRAARDTIADRVRQLVAAPEPG